MKSEIGGRTGNDTERPSIGGAERRSSSIPSNKNVRSLL